MNHLETFLSWSTLSFEILLCGFVFVRRVERVLPLFATFACVSLVSTIGVWLAYAYFGFATHRAYVAYWTGTFLFVIARSLAIAELCRYGLRHYLGIWALVWRVLAALSVFFLAHAAIDAWGQPDAIGIYGTALSRDLALASIAILTALLLIRTYYGLGLDSLQKLIAAGICFTCAVDVVGNTLLKNLFTGYLYSWFLASQKALWPALEPQVVRASDLWSTFHLASFMVSIGIWCYALRRPLAGTTQVPSLLPAAVYREMSPAINMHLATFSDRLVKLLNHE